MEHFSAEPFVAHELGCNWTIKKCTAGISDQANFFHILLSSSPHTRNKWIGYKTSVEPVRRNYSLCAGTNSSRFIDKTMAIFQNKSVDSAYTITEGSRGISDSELSPIKYYYHLVWFLMAVNDRYIERRGVVSLSEPRCVLSAAVKTICKLHHRRKNLRARASIPTRYM